MNEELEKWREGAVSGIGPRALWAGRSGWTGVLCSRRVPASLILAAQDWANALAREYSAPAPSSPDSSFIAAHSALFVGGWHSPLEQEIERILARGKVPLVLAAARSSEKMRVPIAWRERIGENRGLVVSPFESGHRLTSHSALARNRWILKVCPRVVIPHAASGGALHALLMETLLENSTAPNAPQIGVFAHSDHAELIAAGALPITSSLPAPRIQSNSGVV